MSERNAFRYQGMNIAKMKSHILNYIIFIFTEQSASNINLLIAITFAYAKTLWISGIFLLNLKTIFSQLGKYMAISDKMIEMVSIFTGNPSSKYEHRRASALLRNIQNIRICMGKKPIVSVTYENERISIIDLLKSFHFRTLRKR